jgi:hypothetical protein
MKAQAHNLASARVKMAQATAAAALPEGDLATLEERLVDAQTKHASALADLRAGRLDEAVAGARMTVADADAADLEKMIGELRPKVEIAENVREKAAQAVQAAERAVERAEQEAAMAALDAHIAHVEARLCEAIAARFRLCIAFALLLFTRSANVVSLRLLMLFESSHLVFDEYCDALTVGVDAQQEVGFAIRIRNSIAAHFRQVQFCAEPRDKRVTRVKFFHQQQIDIALGDTHQIVAEARRRFVLQLIAHGSFSR